MEISKCYKSDLLFAFWRVSCEPFASIPFGYPGIPICQDAGASRFYLMLPGEQSKLLLSLCGSPTQPSFTSLQVFVGLEHFINRSKTKENISSLPVFKKVEHSAIERVTTIYSNIK